MSRSVVENLKRYSEFCRITKVFDRNLKMLKYHSVKDGKVKAEFNVTEDHLDNEGHLHTGLTTTLIDMTSVRALFTHRNGFVGMSINIHTSYFQPALLGDVICVDAEVCKILQLIGAMPIAFVDVELSKKNGVQAKNVIARGQHLLTTFKEPSKNV
ncbi:acyl-coenzyme A thioesterase 13-like isoform X1 [Neodiprion lecontei]|uniref:Acyl-coenzyme A thioesterase 13-like isoform X1 n=1 Tax=Neodiprion lecontei TaxID=441921 RepID=A0A6J0BNG5_NEOLC|nr:acyl-coenzyme A thioesterase 13-like isoform X1 [Neodiprion lecontei]XP_046469296.1 acyl-coenzyme A thioesterase 13-like isoform X1 [Neodiprion pinetum]